MDSYLNRSTFVYRRCFASFFITVVVACGGERTLPGQEVDASGQAAEVSGQAALQVFEDRIMPIFKSPKPSSCVQCHLSSVDIKEYILPSATATFVSLREAGLIDIQNPPESKILKLIQMGEKDADRKAQLIHRKTRQAEYEAFSTWIEACCADKTLRDMAAPAGIAKVGPEKPLEVVRHSRKSRVVESFERNVWSQRMRCFPCHTPNELDSENPRHPKPIATHRELVKKYGQRMNIFRETPEATLERLISSSRRPADGHLPMINIEDPSHSLLLLKPTAKLPGKKADGTFEAPGYALPVSHMGGLKMHVNDQSYKSFMAWLEDYANVVGGDYASIADLPDDNWVPTQKVLRVAEVPESWGKSHVVQLFVYAAKGDRGWSPSPLAFTQGIITPRRFVNGPLSLFRTRTAEGEAAEVPELKPGKYLVKAYVDRDGDIAEAPTLMLGEKSFVGQAVVNAHWQTGFPNAEKMSGRAFKD